MRFVRFVCLFAFFISMLVLAQFKRTASPNLPNGLPAVEPHQEMTSNVLHRQHGSSFGQRTARALNANAPRRGLPPSGLNFANAVAYASGGIYAYSVATGDVNGDGKPDLVVANECNGSNCSHGTVGVLLGNGDGTFQPAVSYGSGGVSAQSVQVADVNADGKLDLVVANCTSGDSNCTGTGAVGVLLGNGDGTFQPAVSYGSGGAQAYSVATGDVNGDGKPDLLVANSGSNTVGVLLGNGDGTFQPAVSYGSGGVSAQSVQVADVNADGKLDVLVANRGDATVGVLLGNGDGTFQTAVPYSSGAIQANSVAVADVNADGKPDLLVANFCANIICANGAVTVLLGNGDGTFQPAVSYGSGGLYAYSVATADVDGDGNLDLLVANQCAESSCDTGSLGVLLGNGDGTFQTVLTYSSGGSQALFVAVADVNGDSKPDLLVANFCASSSCGSGTVGVLINTSLEATATMLVSSLNPSGAGQAVTFTATVTPKGTGTPTGTVSFFDGTTNIGNSALNSGGVAVLTASTLSVGTHGITATYNGDSNFGSSRSRVLYQVVQGAIVSLSPISLKFGNQTVGIISTPQHEMLTNTGNINLTIRSIQITGTNSGDFAQTNNCSSSLPPNNICKIRVTFTPSGTGTRNAAISITDNAPGSPQSVPLRGVGVLPAATFSPTRLTFPTQLIFTTSQAQPITLTNKGLGTLLISKIAVAGTFAQTNNCPNSLGSGNNCTIQVSFHPKTKGVQNGAVSVTDNEPGSPQKVPLTGTGTFVQLVPTKVNFGTQPVGTRSLAKKITLTNKGNAAVKITGIAIIGTDAGDFAETNTCGESVASGASCFIKVTFKPLAKGKRTANVSVYDNGGGSPQQAMLIGTGT
jgi:hypothetical protein